MGGATHIHQKTGLKNGPYTHTKLRCVSSVEGVVGKQADTAVNYVMKCVMSKKDDDITNTTAAAVDKPAAVSEFLKAYDTSQTAVHIGLHAGLHAGLQLMIDMFSWWSRLGGMPCTGKAEEPMCLLLSDRNNSLGVH